VRDLHPLGLNPHLSNVSPFSYLTSLDDLFWLGSLRTIKQSCININSACTQRTTTCFPYCFTQFVVYYYYYYLLQLSFHSVAADLTLVANNNIHTRKKYKNTVQTIQNTVNTSAHITETPTRLSKHPHITKPTHYKKPHLHAHILQNKLKQPQYKIHTK